MIKEYSTMLGVLLGVVLLGYMFTNYFYRTESTTNLTSCSTGHIPSIGTYEEYGKSLKTYMEGELGFSFQYPPHLAILPMETQMTLHAQGDAFGDLGMIIVSTGLNDENITPEGWLLSPNSGYVQSKDRYGDCHKTTIDGQDAVYTDGGMWFVVNTPDNKYRLSIAVLTTDQASPPFTEMGIVMGSFNFLPPKAE